MKNEGKKESKKEKEERNERKKERKIEKMHQLRLVEIIFLIESKNNGKIKKEKKKLGK